MAIVRSIELFFQEGTSDKVYNVYIVDDGGKAGCTVKVEWGRRTANNLNEGTKASAVSRDKADKVFDKLVHEKTRKGYQEITKSTQPAEVAPPEGEGSGSKVKGKKQKVGYAAQLLNPIDDDEIEAFLTDADMVAQQKLDGVRILAIVEEDEIIATNRNGQRTDKISRQALVGLESLPIGTVVDGEVLGHSGTEELWLFDVLKVGDDEVHHRPYAERFALLFDELEPGLSGDVKVLPIHESEDDKRALLEKLMAAQAEGMVFKDKTAPYKAGRPSSGGPQRKYKLTKSADVVITKNAGNAYTMAVYDGKKLVEVGNVFSGTTNESRKEIDALLGKKKPPVAEVRYLYATDDEQLFQPVFVRLRTDKTPQQCTRAQLQKTNKDVVGDEG